MELTIKFPRRRQRLKESEGTDDYETSNPVVEICLTSATGLGVVAKQDIERGTRIICEGPLISLKGADCKPSRLWKHLEALTPWDLHAFDGLSSNGIFWDRKNYHCIHNAMVASSRVSIETDMMLEDRITIEVQRYAIWETNAVSIGTTETRYGLFPISARFNHSCTPNVFAHYNPALNKLTVHAIRNIEANEELVISYINPAQSHRKRESALVSYGITCRCELCCLHPTSRSEKLRNRINDHERALKAFDGNPEGTKRPPPHLIPRDFKEALIVAEETVCFLKEANLTDIHLASALHRCSKYCLQLNMLQAAKGYAQKQLEVEICCYGPVSEYHSTDIGDAAEMMKKILAVETENEWRKKLADAGRFPTKQKAKKQGKKSGKRNGKW